MHCHLKTAHLMCINGKCMYCFIQAYTYYMNLYSISVHLALLSVLEIFMKLSSPNLLVTTDHCPGKVFKCAIENNIIAQMKIIKRNVDILLIV